jgi:predicted aspartyl protease
MPRDRDDRPRVEVQLISPSSGKSVRTWAVVDTGAAVTCVPRSVLDSLGPLDYSYKPVHLALGPARHVTSAILTLRFGGVEIEDIDCLTIDRNYALLGWDVLSDPKALVAAARPLFHTLVLMLEHISAFKEKFVLVIGQDTTRVERLRTIQSRLETLGYKGVMMRDIAASNVQCLEEKVTMLGSLCRFIICENSTPSGHIAELQICTRNRFVTALLERKGRRATLMQADYGADFTFVKTFEYEGAAKMPTCIDRAVAWANQKLADRAKSPRSFDKIRKRPSKRDSDLPSG